MQDFFCKKWNNNKVEGISGIWRRKMKGLCPAWKIFCGCSSVDIYVVRILFSRRVRCGRCWSRSVGDVKVSFNIGVCRLVVPAISQLPRSADLFCRSQSQRVRSRRKIFTNKHQFGHQKCHRTGEWHLQVQRDRTRRLTYSLFERVG